MQARDIALVGVRMDLGAGRRGVDMGPSAIRIAGLVAAIERLGHRVHEVGTVYASEPEEVEQGESQTRYLSEITEACAKARDLVKSGLGKDCFPLILGGDHSLSIGTAAAVADHYHARGEKLGLIWVDAHGDLNTPETTPSGNIHGMSLAVLTGEGHRALIELADVSPSFAPEHVCIIGARELDAGEREKIRARGIRVFTMTEIDERGLAVCMNDAVALATEGTAGFHMSFDLDCVDPMVAPGVGTPVPGGFSYREAHLICEKAARSGGLVGLEMVELNPVLDNSNRTARLAVGLTASALGQTIL